jgi:hypothetical protein
MITRKQNYDMVNIDIMEKYCSIIYEINDSDLKLDKFKIFFKFINENKYYIKKYNKFMYDNIKIYINYAINLLTKYKKILTKSKEFASLYTELFYLKNKINIE